MMLLLAAGPCVGDGETCMELGFSSNLLCSSCRELKEFGLEALEDDCKECCQAEGINSEDMVSSTNETAITYDKNAVIKI